jgi:thymidylate kinase
MDLRINKIFKEEISGDISFTESDGILGLIFGTTKYTKNDMRSTWHLGIKRGIEIGLRRAGLESQKIELDKNTINEKHKEFLEKFYQLAAEYQCAIQYHPEMGMVIVDRKP